MHTTWKVRGTRFGLAVAALLVALTVLVGSAQPAAAATCNCVPYVRAQTGLGGGPATAAGYNAPGVMDRLGYKAVSPRAGAIMVMNAGAKGAFGTGHIAIVNSATYDSRARVWRITVRHANWQGACPFSTTNFAWGDLNGVQFYVHK